MSDKSIRRRGGRQVVLLFIIVILAILIAGTVLVYRGDVVILIPKLQNLDRDRVAFFDPAFLLDQEDNVYLAKMYFISVDGISFVQEERTIKGGRTPNERAIKILSELILGPASEDKAYLLPPSLEVREVYLDEGGKAYVDFTKELTRRRWGDTDWAIAVLHSLVKTLTVNFPQVQAVQILVEGEDLEALLDVDTSRPLSERDFVAGQVGRTQEDQTPEFDSTTGGT